MKKLTALLLALCALYALATHDRPVPVDHPEPDSATDGGAFGGWKPSRQPVSMTDSEEAQRVAERVKHARRIIRLQTA